jgi:hypothetical protein
LTIVELPTATSTGTITSSRTSTTPTSTASNTGTPAPSSTSGLSGGAKTGIGVGVAVGAIGLLAAGIAFFFLRQHKLEDIPVNMNPAPAMYGEYCGHGQKYRPVDSNPGSYVQMQQMGGDSMQKPSELSSDGDLNHEINSETVAGNTAGRNERGFS